MLRPKKVKSVSVTMDGKPFSGTIKQTKRKTVMKVSNPTLGTSKMVDKLDKNSAIKKQKTVDVFPSGKRVVKKVTYGKSKPLSSKNLSPAQLEKMGMKKWGLR